MDKMLKRGDTVRRSIPGARGFFYPDTEGQAIMIRKDCVAVSQTGWKTCENYEAYQVPSDVVADKDQYGSQPMMVVWVGMDG